VKFVAEVKEKFVAIVKVKVKSIAVVKSQEKSDAAMEAEEKCSIRISLKMRLWNMSKVPSLN